MIDAKDFIAPIIAIILISAVIVPVVSGLAVNEETVIADERTNPTVHYASRTPAESASVHIEKGEENSVIVTADGRTFTVDPEPGLALMIFGSYCLKYSASENPALYPNRGATVAWTYITVENGSYEIGRSSTPLTGDLSGAVWHIAESGDYGIYTEFRANDGKEIAGYNTSKFPVGEDSTVNLRIRTVGTVASMGVSYAFMDGSVNANVTSSMTAAFDYVEEAGEVYSVSGMALTYQGIVDEPEGYTFFAPVKYSIYSTVEEPSFVNTLMNLIPVILLVGVAISVVAMITSRKNGGAE